MGGRIGPVCNNLADATSPEPMGPAAAASWAQAFEEFFVARKTNADAIADLALENFEEVIYYTLSGFSVAFIFCNSLSVGFIYPPNFVLVVTSRYFTYISCVLQLNFLLSTSVLKQLLSLFLFHVTITYHDIVQMRDRVSDRKFLLQKKVENRIENALGHKFRSGYAMVCYGGAGNVTYRNAFILSRVQVHIVLRGLSVFVSARAGRLTM